jgi:hypothetical protein
MTAWTACHAICVPTFGRIVAAGSNSGSMAMRQVGLALVILIAGYTAATAAEAPYLTDAIKSPAYLRTLTALLKSAPKLPSWTRQVLSPSGNYVGTPATYATVGGSRYELFFTCKAHDCNQNNLEVMFAPDGAQAFGALVVNGRSPSYLGAPNPAQQAALAAALKQ